MQLYQRKDSSKWWVSWSGTDGKRYRRSTGTDDRKLAEALGAKWVKEEFMEQHFGVIADEPFNDALLAYAKVQKRDHNRSFMATTRYRIEFLRKNFGHMTLGQITAKAIQDFAEKRLDVVSRDTVSRDLSVLRAVLNRAKRDGRLREVPVFPRFPKPRARKRWLTLREEERLLAVASPHMKPLIRFAIDTGGRMSELLRLDWRYVDIERRIVTFVETKNGEDRTVRLCDRAVAVLEELGPEEDGPVFTFRGQSVASVKKAFMATRDRAGLYDVRFHDLRHTFASRLVQGGLPLYHVMQMTGHKSLDMVQRYAHLAPDYQDAAVEVLNRTYRGDNPKSHDFGTVIPAQKQSPPANFAEGLGK
ncbi:tyrosine-type recombinase/integrase [Pacificispira sp.]|uniref:tyrosine-type recombinase/integrase n=1 Tax=Pacificispira sp. TaxID=2888761 RepID=UPI003B5242D7